MAPSVSFSTDAITSDHPIGIEITSDGPGPAELRGRMTYFYDGRAIGTSEDLAALVENPERTKLFCQTSECSDELASTRRLSPDVLNYGERRRLPAGYHRFVLSYNPRPDTNAKDLNNFADLVIWHLAVDATYCPILPGECHRICSITGKCSPPKAP
jgi:hypothetical protein